MKTSSSGGAVEKIGTAAEDVRCARRGLTVGALLWRRPAGVGPLRLEERLGGSVVAAGRCA